jgi:hypothetical protein
MQELSGHVKASHLFKSNDMQRDASLSGASQIKRNNTKYEIHIDKGCDERVGAPKASGHRFSYLGARLLGTLDDDARSPPSSLGILYY